jgi:hypothetical protein
MSRPFAGQVLSSKMPGFFALIGSHLAASTSDGTEFDVLKPAHIGMENDMNVASEFAGCSIEELKALLDGGSLTVYSVARPITADRPVDRSGVLATFKFASPAFGPGSDGVETAQFAANPVSSASVGTPGFARACKADGTVVADFSAGPGHREVKFAEVSCSQGAPVKIITFVFMAEGGWPERPDYYDSHPQPGFAMPMIP